MRPSNTSNRFSSFYFLSKSHIKDIRFRFQLPFDERNFKCRKAMKIWDNRDLGGDTLIKVQ